MSEYRTYLDLNGNPIVNTNKIKILETAIDLFSRKGYSGVSIREITREVGIKESSLYNHFASKEELLGVIFLNFRRAIGEILLPPEMLRGALKQMIAEQFLQQGVINFKAHIDDPINARIWRIVTIEQYRDPLARSILVEDIIQRTLSFLESAFALMIEQGAVKPHPPKLLAAEYQYPLFGMITEYNLQKYLDQDTSAIEQSMADHIEFFLSHVRTA
ncbi:TetR/AcrR family transcriptional regulator [Paenibacillus sedimenti]|uniref:TetR/AcrR family transcriptional regulator n=1 Tax=Paenibacillus sedimenti TaxID=2770274 RepID=A0A926QL54_9BACL|nr:TetR/AcrR family transcriptional regulator [Paenibacillus sedimenti]MBD0382498.1 TetR/AcrR family transcriptional regulator [Paenibacillus sedimenti]